MASRSLEREEPPCPKRHRSDDSGAAVDEVVTAGNMQRYLVTVEYIGTRYFGFQKQKGQDCRTVQGALEDAFLKFVGKPVESAPSSRTDAGVHALRNTCHVDVERVSKRKAGEILPPHEPGVVKRAVNHFLQKNGEDVQIVDVRCISRDFHARFEAKERTYYYRIIVSNEPLSVFEKDRAWHLLEQLNIPAMQEACKFLVGHHDFSSFRASGCQAKSPIKTLDELHVRETPCWLSSCLQPLQKECDKENVREAADVMVQSLEKGTCRKDDHATANPPKELSKPHCYVITARARSFLYHQVRLMVGLLKAVGTGDLQVRDVSQILEARTVTKAPPMAPACGLYLGDVKYEFET